MNYKEHRSIYEKYPTYEQVEEDEKCRHYSIDYSLLDSLEDQLVWKCCNCGCKFNAQEVEAIKEEHIRKIT